MTSLYRTYRPKTFGDVFGQEHVVTTLKRAIEQDKVNHAYLFQGPRGTGKTTLARLLAMRVNCQKPKKAEPCGICGSCKALLNGASLDIVEIDAASNRGIDDIRNLRDTVATAPAGGKRKVYIIDEVHMLTNEAFAALLKTLEEPSPHAIFVLATTELHKVPETIVSRCQVFRLRRASESHMKERIEFILKKEKKKLQPDIISFVISRSDGCYRDAESLLGQILTVSDASVSIDSALELLGIPDPAIIKNFLSALEEKDARKALSIVDDAYTQGFDPELIVEESIRTAREDIVRRTKEGASLQNVPSIVRALIQAKQDLAYVPQPLIALELAIVTIAPAGTVLTTPNTLKESIAPLPAKQQAAAPTPSPSPAPPSSQSTISLEQVASAWPSIVQKLKEQNPAASTFLRAMEPISISDSTLTIRAQFPLHRNFFEKEGNRATLTSIINSELKSALTIRIHLDEQQPVGAPASRQAKESELLQNVKEVFGAK